MAGHKGKLSKGTSFSHLFKISLTIWYKAKVKDATYQTAKIGFSLFSL